MKDANIAKDCYVPMVTTPEPVNKSLSMKGDLDRKEQAKLKKAMNCSHRNILGKLTYAMITRCPDISYKTVKCAKTSACLAEVQFHAIKHCRCYLYAAQKEGLYFWLTVPHNDLPNLGVPKHVSNDTDLLEMGRKPHGAYNCHG